jgi:hypothetical protein
MFIAALGWSFAQHSWLDGTAPFPFVWRDVFVLQMACAAPAAWLLAGVIERWMPSFGCLACGPVACFTSVFLQEALQATSSGFLGGILLRAAIALGLALSLSIAMRQLVMRQATEQPSNISCLLSIAALIVLPGVHVGARARHDAGVLGELEDQGRVGEARTIARRLVALDAQRVVRGRPLSEVAAKLDRDVAALEAIIASALPPDATPTERFARARNLAMLGRTQEALDILLPCSDQDAEILRGTILEARQEWEPALAAYRAAQTAWQGRAASKARTGGLVRAATGIGYCQQKLGQYAEAEASYLQLLELDPSGDSHFLLAQFYRDTEEAEKARVHARLAIAFDSDNYGRKGESLIQKLADANFGCLSVYRAESARLRPSLGAVGN